MASRGEVVLVPFPFSDLETHKVRPALVVTSTFYEKATGSVIVAMITSISHTTRYDYKLNAWQAANLLHPSWVRVKLATLDTSLIKHTIGTVHAQDLREVDKRIQVAMRMNYPNR